MCLGLKLEEEKNNYIGNTFCSNVFFDVFALLGAVATHVSKAVFLPFRDSCLTKLLLQCLLVSVSYFSGCNCRCFLVFVFVFVVVVVVVVILLLFCWRFTVAFFGHDTSRERRG